MKYLTVLFIASLCSAQTSFNYNRQWATYLGGINSNFALLAEDSQHNIILDGWTNKTNASIPNSYYDQFITPGMQQFTGNYHFLKAKLSSSGALQELGYGKSWTNPIEAPENVVHREKNGNYYTLNNLSTATPGVWQSSPTEAIFRTLQKYDVNNHLIWSTFVPTLSTNFTRNFIQSDSAGNVYLSGFTFSQNLADSGTAFPNYTPRNIPGNAAPNSFVVKLNSHGQKIWATYLPSSAETAISLYGNSLYVGTSTDLNSSDTNFATPGSFQQTKAMIAITHLDATTGARIWGTYYGNTVDEAAGLQAMGSNEDGVYILGAINNYFGSTGGYFASPDAFQPQYAGGEFDLFLAKFSKGGTRTWGTYFGTPDSDLSYGGNFAFNMDVKGNKILFTHVQSGTYNLSTPGAFSTTKNTAGFDYAFSMFDTNGTRTFTSYYGGIPFNQNGFGFMGTLSDTGNAFYLYGLTSSPSGFTEPGAVQGSIIYPPSVTTGQVAFAAKFTSTNLSVNETSKSANLQLFDNPNNGVFFIEGDILEKEKCSFKLLDISGRLIQQGILGLQKKQSFDYQLSLTKGNYILSIFNSKNDMIKTFKMTVK